MPFRLGDSGWGAREANEIDTVYRVIEKLDLSYWPS
jgi:hypothetical protein